MLDAHYLVWLVVFLALAFDYINGFHDTANAIATSVSTRAIEPKKAIMMTAALNFLGAMVSTGVATVSYTHLDVYKRQIFLSS